MIGGLGYENEGFACCKRCSWQGIGKEQSASHFETGFLICRPHEHTFKYQFDRWEGCREAWGDEYHRIVTSSLSCLADREMKTMIFEAVNVVEDIQKPFYLYTVDYW